MMNMKERFENITLKKSENFAPIILLLLILALCWKLASIFWWVVGRQKLNQN